MRALALVLLSACAVQPETTESESAIWAQNGNAPHQWRSATYWETVLANAPQGYALASTTTYAALVPSTTLRMFVRSQSDGCIRGYINVDGEATWRADGTTSSCADPRFNGEVSAVSWATNRYDLFWFRAFFGANPHLMHGYYDGSWHEEDLGATATSTMTPPAVGSWATGHLDILWRDVAGDLRRRAFDRGRRGLSGYTASGWQIGDTAVLHGLPANATISVVEPKVNEIDVAWRTDNGLFTLGRTVDDATWTAVSVGFVDERPALASWGPNHLIAIAPSAGYLRQFTRIGTTWSIVDTSTESAVSHVVAAASPTRANRVDILASPDGAAIRHTLFQESLPGFAELYNPQTAFWCWADAAGAAINYMNQGLAAWTPKATCDYVTTDEGIDCCGLSPNPVCLRGGDSEDVFDEYGFSYSSTAPLSISQVRFLLQYVHQPVLAHEDHNTDSGAHIVVLRDTYRLGGIDYVVIADPADYGYTWVWPYATFLAYDVKWHVDYMLSAFNRE